MMRRISFLVFCIIVLAGCAQPGREVIVVERNRFYQCESASAIEKKMVKTGMIEKKYADTMRHLYVLSKKILRKEIHGLSGETYDKYKKHSEALVLRMRKFIEEREKV